MPHGHFRRGVGLRRSLPLPNPTGRPTAPPQPTRGLQWAPVERAHRLAVALYLPKTTCPALGVRLPAETQRWIKAPESSRRWSTTSGPCCAWPRVDRRSARPPHPALHPQSGRRGGYDGAKRKIGLEGPRGGGRTPSGTSWPCASRPPRSRTASRWKRWPRGGARGDQRKRRACLRGPRLLRGSERRRRPRRGASGWRWSSISHRRRASCCCLAGGWWRGAWRGLRAF